MNPLNELKAIFSNEDKWGIVVSVGLELKIAVNGEVKSFPYYDGFAAGDLVIVRKSGAIDKRVVGVSSYEV